MQRGNQWPILAKFKFVNLLNIKGDNYLGLGEASLEESEVDWILVLIEGWWYDSVRWNQAWKIMVHNLAIYLACTKWLDGGTLVVLGKDRSYPLQDMPLRWSLGVLFVGVGRFGCKAVGLAHFANIVYS